MSYLSTYQTLSGGAVQIVEPEPLVGTAGQALNSNFKNISESILNVVNTFSSYLPLSGGELSGTLNVNGRTIQMDHGYLADGENTIYYNGAFYGDGSHLTGLSLSLEGNAAGNINMQSHQLQLDSTVITGEQVTGIVSSDGSITVYADNWAFSNVINVDLGGASLISGDTTIYSSGSFYGNGSNLTGIGGDYNYYLNSGSDIRFNGSGDTNWRMGILNAFSTAIVGQATSLQIIVGQGTEGPDGFAIGQCSDGSSLFEISGYSQLAYVRGRMLVNGASDDYSTALLVNGDIGIPYTGKLTFKDGYNYIGDDAVFNGVGIVGWLGAAISSEYQQYQLTVGTDSSNLPVTNITGRTLLTGPNSFTDDGTTTLQAGGNVMVYGNVTSSGIYITPSLIGNIAAGFVGDYEGGSSPTLDFGLNPAQFGSRNQSIIGSIFRLDSRSGYPFFSVRYQPTGGNTENTPLQITSTGQVLIGNWGGDNNTGSGGGEDLQIANNLYVEGDIITTGSSNVDLNGGNIYLDGGQFNIDADSYMKADGSGNVNLVATSFNLNGSPFGLLEGTAVGAISMNGEYFEMGSGLYFQDDTDGGVNVISATGSGNMNFYNTAVKFNGNAVSLYNGSGANGGNLNLDAGGIFATNSSSTAQIVSNGSNGWSVIGSVFMGASLVTGVYTQTVTTNATTINPVNGNVFIIPQLAGNITVTVSNGTSASDGQVIRIRFTQPGSGNHTLAWGGSNIDDPNGYSTLSVSSGVTDVIALEWNYAKTQWMVTAIAKGY